jgi:predicted DCC family thiol-disulfide oxidoreductase YuxK
MKSFTLFYDGACPLCQAEILFLQNRNQAGLLHFVDINSAQYDPQKIGVSCEEALASIYGQIEGESPMNGVAVFGEAYRRANLPLMAWIFSRRWMMPILGPSYRFFAKHRHGISGFFGPPLLRLVKARFPNKPNSS